MKVVFITKRRELEVGGVRCLNFIVEIVAFDLSEPGIELFEEVF